MFGEFTAALAASSPFSDCKSILLLLICGSHRGQPNCVPAPGRSPHSNWLRVQALWTLSKCVIELASPLEILVEEVVTGIEAEGVRLESWNCAKNVNRAYGTNWLWVACFSQFHLPGFELVAISIDHLNGVFPGSPSNVDFRPWKNKVVVNNGFRQCSTCNDWLEPQQAA